MYRLIEGGKNTLEIALNYAFVEHLLRATTPEQDETYLTSFFDKKVSIKLLRLTKSKREKSPQDAIRNLEASGLDFGSFSARPYLFANIVEKDSYDIYTSYIGPESVGSWPIIDVFSDPAGKRSIILYSREMNYLDGYDRFLSEIQYPVIPPVILTSYRNRLTRNYEAPRKVITEVTFVSAQKGEISC